MSTVCRELQTLANIWQTLQDSKKTEKADSVGMNLFKVLRIQNKEVLICRLLGELLGTFVPVQSLSRVRLFVTDPLDYSPLGSWLSTGFPRPLGTYKHARISVC